MTVSSELRCLATIWLTFSTVFALCTPANAASAEVEALAANTQIGRQIALGSVSWDRGREPNSDAVVATVVFPPIDCSITATFNFRTIEEYIHGFYAIDVGEGCINDWGAISMYDFDQSKPQEIVNHFESALNSNPDKTYSQNVALLRENNLIHLKFASKNYGHIVINFEKGERGKNLFN